MGSRTPQSLPDKASPDLILTLATDAERRRSWSLTHPIWGSALSHEGYLNREAYMTTVPLAKNGGITHWILTDRTVPKDQRPILSSCETIRKSAVCACRSVSDSSNVTVSNGIAHSIGSVFTDPQYRGRGYADRMLRELTIRLRGWQVSDKSGSNGDKQDPSDEPVLFTVLYSDIGKTFYARRGWQPFDSRHATFPPVPGAASGLAPQDGYCGAKARPIGYHELAELCNVDERLLRAELVRRAGAEAGESQEVTKRRACVALLPDLDQLLWHLMREDFMTKHIFGRTPAVKGAVFGNAGRRVWAVWTRGYYGGLEQIEGNTLHILRVVVEDESQPDEYVVEGFRAIVQIAQAEAVEWRAEDVQMWNPTPRLERVIKASGLEHEFVDRESKSIASLMWCADGVKDVDWVANEKYGWC